MPDKVFRLIIDVDSRKAKRGAGEAESAMSRLQNRIAQVGVAAAGAGVALGVMVAKTSIRNAIEQAQAIAGLEAAIKSTGGAAQLSSRELQQMASDIQKVTTTGDEAILRMQGLLLTFKSVKGDNFKRATELIVDMSQKMGSLESNAILLGKALDDPAKRASELSRSGIVLTETQKDLIRQLDATGQRAKAQAIILEEVATQFGGLGAAAAQAAGGGVQQFSNAIGDLSEKLGGPLAQRLDEIAGVLREATESGSAGFGLEGFGRFIAEVSRGTQPITAFHAAVLRMWLDISEGATNAGRDVALVSNSLREFGRATEQAAEEVDQFDRATDRMFAELRGPAVRSLNAVNSALDSHRQKLVEIEDQYRKDIQATRDWIKGIQDLEQNFRDFEDAVGIGTGGLDLDITGFETQIDAMIDQFTEGIADSFDPGSGFLDDFASEFSDKMGQALANAFASGDVQDATDGLINALSAAAAGAANTAVQAALPGAGQILGPIAGGIAGGLAQQLLGGLFGDDEEAKRQAQEMEAAFKDLHDAIRSSMPSIRQEIIQTFETILEMLRLVSEAGQSTGEEMAAINRELQAAVDSITGITTGDFADRIRAAQEFNETLATLPQDIQAAFDQIDLAGLADSIVAEFQGITSQLELAQIQRDAQNLREAIAGLGLESERTSDLIRQVRDAERLRTQELEAGVFVQLADLLERAGIRSAEAAQLRAKYEQIQFQVALKRLEIELKLLDLWTKATAAIIGELTEFASKLGNFVGSVTAGISAPIAAPRIGGRRGGRRQRRREFLDELERLMDPSGGPLTFADRLRDLNEQFAELRKRAIKLKVPLDKVNAAYDAQIRALREQAQAGLRDFRDSLLSGPQSGLSLQQQFFAARSRFNDLARRAAAGDLDATAELSAAGRDYLELARQMFGTTRQFNLIMDEVLNLINGILGTGGLKDEEANQHQEVISQLQGSDMLREDLHVEAQDKRQDIYRKTRDSANILAEMRDILERMEAA